ncbi:MAG: LLM class F420-dependent oxidoreductase [Chloroflexota bacterium]|nr:LLM class F420-dependent oxidoreductase [Chloroflexota bacterium]
MRIGVILPQLEIGADPAILRAYAQAAQDLGYRHLLAYDHVLGADPAARPGWTRYTAADQFHEPFVLFGYLAAAAPALELVTGVIILPQRQTALVAKQAAEVDVLTGGKLRLGVGVGWNAVEYEALGEDFSTRGRRIEEQVDVLRLLWTQPVITFHGRYHHVSEAGINPLPVQRPIPLWMGGGEERVLQRIGRMADGWFPRERPDAGMAERIERLRSYAEAAGRPRDAVAIEGRLSIKDVPEGEWGAEVRRWRDLGATHLGINTMGAGLAAPQDHIDTICHFMEAVRR